ncbi:MAG: hypothetical protein JJU22_03960 [Gammaproteobacteria bacterium]|nr:hypothetical protein [Gammaproteobacteria bacterium]
MTETRSELPAITLPTEPISDTWRDTVELLIERAHTVEAWAEETKQRAQIAVKGHEDVIILLDNVLAQGNYREARRQVAEAAAQIRAQRSHVTH